MTEPLDTSLKNFNNVVRKFADSSPHIYSVGPRGLLAREGRIDHMMMATNFSHKPAALRPYKPTLRAAVPGDLWPEDRHSPQN